MPSLMQRLVDFTHLQDPHRRQSFHDLHPCSYVLLYMTLLVLLVGHSRALPGQALAEGNEGVRARKEFTNSLGMKLVELPGTPVAISIWETRVSDWEAYLNHNGMTLRN